MSSESRNVIIIGAGLAGLAAYHYLAENGFDVMILEARDRAGGRISTNYTLGLPIGAGAGWIHGVDNNPMTFLAEKAGLSMLAMDAKKFEIYDDNGNVIPEQIIDDFNTKFDLLLKKAKEIAFNATHDMSLSDALSGFIKNENFSSIEKSILKTKLLFFENYIGNSYELLSARHWDQEEAWGGDNCFLINSYQPIIDGLVKNCQIHFNEIVKQINRHSSHIEIITDNKKFSCDTVLITVPLGVLKNNSITFNPPLPLHKQESINKLDMGLLNITAIKFPEIFWPRDKHAFFFTQFDSSSISIFFNLYPFLHQPILLGYSGGESGKRIEDFSDEEIIKKIMNNFHTMYGEKIPDPDLWFNTRWSSDVFTYGSYSYIPVGASAKDRENLAEPVDDRLFFAGEASHPAYPATTHGAWLSGLTAAESIKNRGQV